MLEEVVQKLPEVAKDTRLNLNKVLDLTQNDGLTDNQIIGSALAVAYHLANHDLVQGLIKQADEPLIQAAKIAANAMAMSNIYYRFVHFAEHAELSHLPAGLRMQSMMNPGVDKATFEVMALAVSALNGCGACVKAHVRQLQQHHSMTIQAIARIGRISAVIHAAHVSLNFPSPIV